MIFCRAKTLRDVWWSTCESDFLCAVCVFDITLLPVCLFLYRAGPPPSSVLVYNYINGFQSAFSWHAHRSLSRITPPDKRIYFSSVIKLSDSGFGTLFPDCVFGLLSLSLSISFVLCVRIVSCI